MKREQARETEGGEAESPRTTTDSLGPDRAIASGDVAEVARLLRAQPARRDQFLGELHRYRGNAFVQQVLEASRNAGIHQPADEHEGPIGQDEVAHKEPGLLWQRQAGFGGVSAETKSSANTSKSDRRPMTERRAEQSDNATYNAMNTKLKLLAYELHAAGRKLTFDLAVAKAAKKPDKAQIEAADAQLMVTIHHLGDIARETAKQIRDLNTAKGEPRLAEGGQYLIAALDEFRPVMNEVDGWMTAHTGDAPAWEVVGRTNGILKSIFPGVVLSAKPLTSIEKSPGFMKYTSIDAHLDAAIIAAESVKSGNRYHADRVILHAKEVGELLVNHPRISGQLRPRIRKLVSLVDKILVDNPYLKSSFDEAIDPIRNVN